jgi:hypothetical protein
MKKMVVCFLFLSLVVAGGASADPIVFIGSGTAVDGRPMHGTTTIDFLVTPGGIVQMIITLENTAGVGQLGGISSVLDGFSFTFSTAPSLTGITLDSVIAGGVVDCSSGVCVPSAVPVPPLYGWGVSGSLTTWLLAAGDGSYKPYGVVNPNIQTTDGIPNGQHNPYIYGPVRFTLTLAGLTEIPIITGGSFYFGTGPDVISASVPEPTTLLLLGAGIVGIGIMGRKVRKR